MPHVTKLSVLVYIFAPPSSRLSITCPRWSKAPAACKLGLCPSPHRLLALAVPRRGLVETSPRFLTLPLLFAQQQPHQHISNPSQTTTNHQTTHNQHNHSNTLTNHVRPLHNLAKTQSRRTSWRSPHHHVCLHKCHDALTSMARNDQAQHQHHDTNNLTADSLHAASKSFGT